MEVYVTSDLHGCAFDRFQQLLDTAGFSDDSFLFILGDVIDRGEDGVRWLTWLLTQPNAQLILGNHEAMLLSCAFLFETVTEQSIAALSSRKLQLLSTWMSNGAQPTLQALRQTVQQDPDLAADILDYLRDAPLYETVSAGERDFLLVHSGLGGFRADKKLSDYSPEELLWHRPTLSERYFENGVVTVFGHTPTGYYGSEYKGRILKTDTWIDLDTGSGHGGDPSLLRLNDMQEFYLS